MWKVLHKHKLPSLSLLEMVVVISFLTVLLTAGYQVFSVSSQLVERTRQFTLAELLGNDMIEMSTSKRNEDWDSLLPGTFHFSEDPVNGLQIVAGAEQIGMFNRYVLISAVNRDVSGNIVASGGTLDNDTKKIVAYIQWTYKNRSYQQIFTQYLTNWERY